MALLGAVHLKVGLDATSAASTQLRDFIDRLVVAGQQTSTDP
ncbi:hypothetical protein ACIPVK_21705 [Paeniglutamicibacter sp. MACA_103]